MVKEDFQKKQAIECFNRTWDFIDKDERTKEEDLEMVHCAHTSRYLWGLVGKPINIERGEWLLSKVYCILGVGDRALAHGQACLDTCVKEGIGDFDLTFAYECMAKAHKLLGNLKESERFEKLGFGSLGSIEKEEDRKYAESELNKI